MATDARILVVASTSRTDAGRLRPRGARTARPPRRGRAAEPPEQREILELIRARTEKQAGRQLFEPVDYQKVLPTMGGLSGADISDILRRALEAKVHQAAGGVAAASSARRTLLDSIDAYKRVRGWSRRSDTDSTSDPLGRPPPATASASTIGAWAGDLAWSSSTLSADGSHVAQGDVRARRALSPSWRRTCAATAIPTAARGLRQAHDGGRRRRRRRGAGLAPVVLVGHDRGARVAHRFALDHAGLLTRLVLLDIAPTWDVFHDLDRHKALARWHWFFQQLPDLPEALVAGREDVYLRYLFHLWR